MVIKVVVIHMCVGKSLDLISLHISFACNYLLNKLNCLLKPLASCFLLDTRRPKYLDLLSALVAILHMSIKGFSHLYHICLYMVSHCTMSSSKVKSVSLVPESFVPGTVEYILKKT